MLTLHCALTARAQGAVVDAFMRIKASIAATEVNATWLRSSSSSWDLPNDTPTDALSHVTAIPR